MISGFLGGLISSTALTASLAKESKTSDESELSMLSISFLSGTLAMLTEALLVTFLGTDVFPIRILPVFLAPFMVTLSMIIYRSMKSNTQIDETLREKPLRIVPLLKLALFIIAILGLSKILQNFFGQSGLMALTFIISLFEVHGSIIANVQIESSRMISDQVLCTLLAISVISSHSALAKALKIFEKRFERHRVSF